MTKCTGFIWTVITLILICKVRPFTAKSLSARITVSSNPKDPVADSIDTIASSGSGLRSVKHTKSTTSTTGLHFKKSGRSAALDNATVKVQKPSRIMDLKTKTNVQAVINVSEMSFVDYSDLETGSEDDISFPKMRRETANLLMEKNSSKAPTQVPDDDGPMSPLISSTKHAETNSPTESRALSSALPEANATTAILDRDKHSNKKSEKTEMPPETARIPGLMSHPPSESSDNKTEKPTTTITPTIQETGFPTTQNHTSQKTSNESFEPRRNASQNEMKMNTRETTTELVGKEKVLQTSSTDDKNDIFSTSPDVSNEERLPVVVYDTDPVWYGNPKVLILDDYEVFKSRGCVDFSCKNDF